MKRTKKQVIQPPSKEEVVDVMRKFAEAESHISKLEADEQLAIQEINKATEAKAAEYVAQKQEALAKLEAFGLANKSDVFSDSRTLDLREGTIGFRYGTPKVSKKPGLTWEALKELLPKAYLKTTIKTDVDKTKILNNRENDEIMAELLEAGIRIVRDETFFVKTKQNELEIKV